MKPRFILCLALVSSGGLANIRADMVQGMDWHVAHAEVIEVVQAETPAAAAVFPPPQDKERVWVKDVLKGADTAQEFLLPKSKVQPGQKAVVLFEFGCPAYKIPAVQTPPRELPLTSVWPIDSAGNLNIDAAPANGFTVGQIMLDNVRIKSLELIKQEIAASSPEEVGLYSEVLDALLFQKKFRALSLRDADRATYVRLTIAVHQWNRDVAWITRGDDDWLAMNNAPPGSWYALSDAVNAFGYTSQFEGAQIPGPLGGSALSPEQLRLDVARIEDWRKSQSNKP